MFEKLVLKNGKVRLNDCYFECNDSLERLYDSLKEDLLQIEFNNSYLIDVGWYPEFSYKGTFKIVLVKNGEWDKPKYILETRSLKKLKDTVYFLVESVDE